MQVVLVTSYTHFIRVVGTICEHVFDPLGFFPHDYTCSSIGTYFGVKHSLTYLGPVISSKLNKSIRSSESLYTFKKRIKLVDFISLLDSI